jgi:hypothetical protein
MADKTDDGYLDYLTTLHQPFVTASNIIQKKKSEDELERIWNQSHWLNPEKHEQLRVH